MTTVHAPPPPRRPAAWQLALLGTLVASMVVIGVALARRNAGPPTPGDRAPDFALTTFDGRTYTAADLRGNVVVLNVWASWCVPCIDEAPILEQVWQAYRDRGVVLLGASHSDIEANARAFVAEHRLTFPTGLDARQRIYNAFNARGVPETYVIDRDGRVAAALIGVIDQPATLTTILDDLLSEGIAQ